MNKANKIILGLVFMGSAVSAQSLADAKKAIDAEQYQKGKSMLNALIKADASQPENYFTLGNLYIKTSIVSDRPDYIDSAKVAFDKGVAADDDFALNYVGQGNIQLLRKADATASFNKAMELTKRKDHLTDLHIGKAYLTLPVPNTAQAIVHLEKAKELEPKDAQIFLALGDAYREEKKNSEAFSAYRSAFDLDNSLLRAKVELGKINKLSKAYPESTEEFNSVLALDPNYGPAYRELAETYWLWSLTSQAEYANRVSQALQYYEKYMDLTDRSLDSRIRHADFLYLTKDFESLEKEAQEMAKIDNVNAKVLRYQAYAAFENGNFAESQKALNEFMAQVEPSRIISQDYLYLGKAQMQDSTKFDQAFANLTKAIEMDSTNAAVMSEIGKSLYDEKKYSEAAKAYEFAVLNPDRALIDYWYLGSSYYFDFGNQRAAELNPPKDLLVKADSAYSYLLERSPTTVTAWLYRGRIQRLLDDEVDSEGLAVQPYEQYVNVVTVEKPELAAKSKAGLIESYLYLGSVAARRDGNNDKARDYFDKVLVLDPSNQTA